MRKSAILETLFPGTRGDILLATVLQPERVWFLSELATHLETTPSSLQREITALDKCGILRVWRDGRRLYVQAHRDCPVFLELHGLLEKTGGTVPVLKELLSSLTQKVTAFVFGSVARSEERSTSDIDLMVIGSVGLVELSPLLEKAEERLGRLINPVIYSSEEFETKLARHDHFLTTVLSGPKLMITGEVYELATVA